MFKTYILIISAPFGVDKVKKYALALHKNQPLLFGLFFDMMVARREVAFVALFVLCDPRYQKTFWCDEKLRGIRDAVARRRQKFHFFTSVEALETAAAKLDEDSSVIVLFDSIPYIRRIAPTLARLPIHVILTGTSGNIRLPFSYSCISPDMDTCGRTIVEYLYSQGKKRIAQIAISQDSWSDIGRADAIAKYIPAENYRVFYIEKSMEDTYAAFLAERENYDAVLCATDYVAISLIEYLKARGAYDESLFLITHGDTVLAKLYDIGITSFTVNYYACGEAAVKLHYDRSRYGWSAVSILLRNEMVIRDSTANAPYKPSNPLLLPMDWNPSRPPLVFPLITYHIGQLGRFLATCEIADLRLIYCMLMGYSYEKMSEACFLSVEAVKYRLRKIRDAIGVGSRRETTAFIRTYVQPEKLLALIAEKER